MANRIYGHHRDHRDDGCQIRLLQAGAVAACVLALLMRAVAGMASRRRCARTNPPT